MSEAFIEPGLFSCKNFDGSILVYCIYSNSTKEIIGREYKREGSPYVEWKEPKVLTEIDIDDNVIKGVLIEVYNTYNGMGIAYVSPLNVLYVFSFVTDSVNKCTLKDIKRTNVPSTDLLSMNIKKMTEGIVLYQDMMEQRQFVAFIILN